MNLAKTICFDVFERYAGQVRTTWGSTGTDDIRRAVGLVLDDFDAAEKAIRDDAVRGKECWRE